MVQKSGSKGFHHQRMDHIDRSTDQQRQAVVRTHKIIQLGLMT